jgi:anti-anti-sigma factor
MYFKAEIRRVKNIVILRAAGELNLNSSKKLEEAAYLINAPWLIVNVKNVRCLDGAGLATLLKLAKRMTEKQGKIWLVSGEVVLKILRLAQVESFFALASSEEEAITQALRLNYS